jgi:ataxia telangiectasia mutated family protein
MQPSKFCADVVKKIRTSTTSVKGLRLKAVELENFCTSLESQRVLRSHFRISPHVKELVIRALELADTAASKKNVCEVVSAAITRLFRDLTDFGIPLVAQEEEFGFFQQMILDIIGQSLTEGEGEHWTFWLQIFTEFLRFPPFFNVFEKETYRKHLFLLFKNLVRFPNIAERDCANQRSLTLKFISVFLEKSPYPPTPDLIDQFLQKSASLVRLELPDDDFIELISILTQLVPMAPISFILNAAPDAPPFEDGIFKCLFARWQDYQQTLQCRKCARAFLLLFLTIRDAMRLPIPQDFIDKWAQRIVIVWSNIRVKSFSLESDGDIPYLRADVELIRKCSENSVSGNLYQCICNRGSAFSLSTNIMFLFTAVAKYAPEVISPEHWSKILERIAIADQSAGGTMLHVDVYSHVCTLLIAMIDVVVESKHWNGVFARFMNYLGDIKSNTAHVCFSLVQNLLAKQRIETKTVHLSQHWLWTPDFTPEVFTLNRLHCIHTCIFYYGFAGKQGRYDCLTALVTVYSELPPTMPSLYMKQLALTIASTIRSHACELLPDEMFELSRRHQESIEDICSKLSERVKIMLNEKKVREMPIQAEKLYFVSPESSQIAVDDDNPDDFFGQPAPMEMPERMEDKRDTTRNPLGFALCNFIDPQTQQQCVEMVHSRRAPCQRIEVLFRIFASSAMPEHFPPSDVLDYVSAEFLEHGNATQFHDFVSLFLEITKSMNGECFQPFFEGVAGVFFEVMSQFLIQCAGTIRTNLRWPGVVPWVSLIDFEFDQSLSVVNDLAQFASNCSALAPEFCAGLWEAFGEFLSTSHSVPQLHLDVCRHLLTMPLGDLPLSQVINSLECVASHVLSTLLVPVKDRELFLISVFDSLKLTMSEPMSDLMQEIAKYSLSPLLKCRVLRLAAENFATASDLFEPFWRMKEENPDPYFVLDTYPDVRLESVDAVASVLKTTGIDNGLFGAQAAFDKHQFFTDVLAPSLDGVLEEPDRFPQDTYTSLATLVKVTAEIPELTVKCLTMIFDTFSRVGLNVFPKQCVRVLLSGLSERVHFSVFLRQFVPVMAPHLSKLITEKSFPFQLFYFDEDNNISADRAARDLVILLVPYLLGNAIIEKNEDLIKFFAEKTGMTASALIQQNAAHVACFYLITMNNPDLEMKRKELRAEYERVYAMLPDGEFTSPLPLLSFLAMMGSEAPITSSYQTILRRNPGPGFKDIRGTVFALYRELFDSHHEIVLSFHLQQFVLYATIILSCHPDEFKKRPTLYSDLLARAVCLIDFAPAKEIGKLLTLLSLNIPDTLSPSAIGLVQSLEQICVKTGFHPSLKNFFDHRKFESIHRRMLILPAIRDMQIGSRSLYSELNRIRISRRLNQESVDFLLQELMKPASSAGTEDSQNKTDDAVAEMDGMVAQHKRVILNTIYEFAMTNPQTLALLLYSQLYERFFSIHPSPSILSCEWIDHERLFVKVIELTRDKNPSISRAALSALSGIIADDRIPDGIPRSLQEELLQYGQWSRPNKTRRQPVEDASWISKYTCGLISRLSPGTLCAPFQNLAAHSQEFVKTVFPFAFLDCLENPILVAEFMHYLVEFGEDPEQYHQECRIFLTAILYLRKTWLHVEREHREPFWEMKWMNVKLNFPLIARIAVAIGDPYTAYQFAEFAHQAKMEFGDSELKGIFGRLDVSDLMYALNTDLSNPGEIALIHRYEKRTSRALVLYNNSAEEEGMDDALRSLHLYNFLGRMKRGDIESLWRLQEWDVSSQLVRDMNADSRPAALFQAMQAFASHNGSAVVQKLSLLLQQFHFARDSSVSDQLSQLLAVSALQWFRVLMFPHQETKLYRLFEQDFLGMYRRNLKNLVTLSKKSFSITESATALHGVFFCIIKNFQTRMPPAEGTRFFSDVIKTARQAREFEAAQYYVSLLRKCESLKQFADFEQSQLLYADNPYHAISLLEKNASSFRLHPGQVNSDKRMDAFNLSVDFAIAKGIAETHCHSSSETEQALTEVISEAENIHDHTILADAHFTFAKFCHNAHRQICEEFKSEEFQAIMGILQGDREIIDHSRQTNAKGKELRQARLRYSQYKETVDQQCCRFRETIISAIEHYMKSLEIGNEYDTESLFSLIELWFSYSFTRFPEIVQEVPNLINVIDERFPNINPEKFLSMFYQLAARVDTCEGSGSQNSSYNCDFQVVLQKIVVEVARASPHHCFPILFALLKNEDARSEGGRTRVVIQSKINAIRDVVGRVAENEDLSAHWSQMFLLLENYCKLAKTPQTTNAITSLSKVMGGNVLARFTTSETSKTSIITKNDPIGIHSFEDRIQVLGGNSRPILLRVKGTDGVVYGQIVKGHKDDLRQDAVMQQFMVLSSRFLRRKNPNLAIRSYKVVPLSPSSGVIEFVKGTISIQDWHYPYNGQSSSTAAFLRYAAEGVDEASFYEIVKRFQEASEAFHEKSSGELRRALFECYRATLKSLPPIFRFFFVEKFPNPGDWFVSRTRYTRLSAANSMVGYVLGIGDRHLNNVLIDKQTGDVIHIDLGIAFEQGKALGRPEKVPFRLTPAILDGMGWKGKESIFQRGCEETMAVLRESCEYLLIVLQVLMDDPLYEWSIVPQKQTHSLLPKAGFGERKAGGVVMAKTADGIIITCRRKLEGRELGEMMSVQGQVARLISEAENVENLALMFHGWKPYI